MREKALKYHAEFGGKLAVTVKTKCENADDLSLAYSPGVAEPCKEIHADEKNSFRYTNRCNLVGVISNGTAVLGLGDIGAAASKPVMEGKAVLFKKFGGVDAYDVEINEKDPKKLVEIIKAIAPTFGGINLEDIKAPECFEVEAALQDIGIPVMHDDQHGTAIITTAGLLNAVELSGKKLDEIKVVVSGSGAAGIGCARMYRAVGVKNIVMLDSKGVIFVGRNDLTKEKAEFAVETEARTLADALKDADMFLGLSKGGVMNAEMVKSMASGAIIFALANPEPEIRPEVAKAVREEIIIGTGRSDYANQVNNVLCFPFLFRGALDAGATCINEEMKIAAAKALAELAKEPVPEEVSRLYGRELKFGPDYIIPTPFDPRLFEKVSGAVREAWLAGK